MQTLLQKEDYEIKCEEDEIFYYTRLASYKSERLSARHKLTTVVVSMWKAFKRENAQSALSLHNVLKILDQRIVTGKRGSGGGGVPPRPSNVGSVPPKGL